MSTLLLGIGLARAGSAEVGVAAELLPDNLGQTDARAQVLVHADASGEKWTFLADGAVRADPTALAGTSLHVERLQVTGDTDLGLFALGRTVALDVRGLLRVDGARGAWSGDGWTTGEAWVGRLVFPEDGVDDPDVWLAGGSFRWAPGPTMEGARFVLEGGAEGRLYAFGGDGRAWLGGGARGLRGAHWNAYAEASARSGELRAELGGAVPIARRADVGLRARWEDLEAAGASPTERSLDDRIAPSGYAVATAYVSGHSGFDWQVDGGPTVGVDRLGGAAGLAASTTGAARVGLAARGVWLGSAGYAGGGLSYHQHFARVGLDAGASLYRLRALDEVDGWVGEARVGGDLVLARSDRRSWTLGGDLAAGADRLRPAWVRGGLALSVRGGIP